MKKPAEINLETPGRLILNHLYEHPDQPTGTGDLLEVLRPEIKNAAMGAISPEKLSEMAEETQREVESLILDRLVRGRRTLQFGRVRHANLQLTSKGEVEAIRKKRTPKRLILDL